MGQGRLGKGGGRRDAERPEGEGGTGRGLGEAEENPDRRKRGEAGSQGEAIRETGGGATARIGESRRTQERRSQEEPWEEEPS